MRRLIVLSSLVALALAGGMTALSAQGPGAPNRGATRGDRPAVADAEPQAAGPGRMRPGRRGGGPGVGGPMRLGFAARGLDLSEEQRTQVEALTRAARDKSGPIADQLRLATSTLHRAVFADARDGAAVAELASQVSALRQQLADIRLETTTSVADLLTPEQREKVRVGPARGLGDGGQAGPVRGGRGRGGRGDRPARG